LSTRVQKSHRAAMPDWLSSGAAAASQLPAACGWKFFRSWNGFISRLFLSAVSRQLSPFLLARRIRRPTHMQMTQIPQRGPILVAHPLGEPWIIQPLISR